jgi:ferredoxin-NADP reductase/uncharacterized protein YcbX
MNIVEGLFRFPLKGFPGQRLASVELRKNEGITGDRAIAIGSGAMAVSTHGEWAPCQAFQRMAIRPDLTRFQIDMPNHALTLTSPIGVSEVINESSSNLGVLNEDFGGKASIHRARDNRGYWDHQDAAISIINLATVEAIAAVLGRPIDPLRFRANIYVRTEPWSEFQWLGKTLDCGDAQLDVIRPIDRCKTTSVNLKTGSLDVNMPAALIRHFGHMFCGVYASVHASGTIESGSKIRAADGLSKAAVSAASRASTAPALPDWPRPATITKILDEAEGVRSFWIEDSLEKIGALKDFEAGQYIRLHDLSQNHVWRSYTVSAVEDGKLRITVKRDEGLGSQAIHQLVERESISITGPFGDATLNHNSDAIHFISAGIGITPTVAKLTELAQRGYDKPVRVAHAARSIRELALWSDIVAAKSVLSNAAVQLYLTRDATGAADACPQRPDLKAIANRAKLAKADVHICGPTGFVGSVIAQLKQADIHDDRIVIDTFNSPDTPTMMRPIPTSKPIKVTLARSKITADWNPEDGTLLDFAEKRGAIIPSHCRAGLCKTCSCKIISGAASPLVGERGHDNTRTLVCSSIPTEPLTLDI